MVELVACLSLLATAAVVRAGRAQWHDPTARPLRSATGHGLAAMVWIVFWESAGTGWVRRCPALAAFEIPLLAPLLLGLAVGLNRAAPEHWLRRPLLFTTGLTAALSIWAAVGPVLLAHGAFRLDRDTVGPVQLQTTWWTCGPAAEAMLIRRLGLPASEASLAVACSSTPGHGTTAAGLIAGLARQGLAGRARWFRGYDDLVAAPKPCLAFTLLGGRVAHVVTVLSADADTIAVADPLGGEARWPKRAFLQAWCRAYVELVPAG